MMRTSAKDEASPGLEGAFIAAAALLGAAKSKRQQLLTDADRTRLALVAPLVRFEKGTKIYDEGEPSDALYYILSGVVKVYKGSPGDGERIGSFLFADDLLGFNQADRYVNSTKAVTAVACYRLPMAALESRLSTGDSPEFRAIAKLWHHLREAQLHAFLLGRRDALGKVAQFFVLLEYGQAARGEDTAELYLPMSRSDVANYVGLSLEAVSRAMRVLVGREIIAFRDRRHVKITDRARLETLVSHDAASRTLRRRKRTE